MSGFRGATLQTIAAIHYRNASNVLTDIAAARFRDASNASKIFFESISASVSPAFVEGFGNSASPVDISTRFVTCSVVGGVAPFNYLWTRTDAGPDTWTIGDNTLATTNFNALAISSDSSATFICTVTDDTGAVAVSPPVSASALNLGGPL